MSRCISRRDLLLAGSAGILGIQQLRTAIAWGEENAKPLRLVTRVDDIGCTRSLNRGVEQCLTEGIAKNASVLAPTPYFAEAAEKLTKLDGVCFGLHTALNSEWNEPRWGPVAPREKVRSLIDKDGNLHQYHAQVKKADAEEALIEFTAQLARARKLGFDIKYADSHMGAIGQIPGLADKFAAWCRSHKILDARDAKARRLSGIPNYWSRPNRRKDDNFPEVFLNALRAADREPLYLIVGHPAFDDAETQKLGHDGYPGSSVAANLNLERRAYTDRAIVTWCRTNNVQLLRYDEVKS